MRKISVNLGKVKRREKKTPVGVAGVLSAGLNKIRFV
jgi:hypothetical protein